MDALALAVAAVIEATGALFGGEDGDLCKGVTVGNEIVVNELAPARADHVGRR